MRFRNLLAVLAAAAVTVAGLTASAAATARPLGRRHPSAAGCKVGLSVAPHRIAAGDPFTAYGRLLCDHKAEGEQQVQLFEHAYGTSGYTAVGSAKTDAQGFYEIAQSGLQGNSSLYAEAGGAVSPTKQIRVEALVTLGGPTPGSQLLTAGGPGAALTGRSNVVTFTGTVSPADGGAEVVLQRQNAITGNEWRWIGRGVVGAEGAFKVKHRFVVPGDANIRVVVRSQGRNVHSASNELSYEISQAQNPQLTIEASADPIEFGQSVTIHGSAAGLAGRSLTLLARVRQQHGFAAVTKTTTNATGEYSFPAQSPTTSTFYKVQTGADVAHSERSAVLFEGVKDVLSASVSPNPVQAGQPLTFSGTITPALVGHIVYLERQNATGNGFHVVQVAAIGAGSAYTLTYTSYSSGTAVFRVRVPGGPANQGAVSQPFTIATTPAPAAALKPEAPGNTSLPSEGSRRNGEEREPDSEGVTNSPEGPRGQGRHKGRHGR